MDSTALRVFERHLLAVVAEDAGYEPSLTINACMSVRFGSRGYPKAVFRALQALHKLGLVSVHEYIPSSPKMSRKYAVRPMPRWSRSWEKQNLWFAVTPSGRSVLKRHASSET